MRRLLRSDSGAIKGDDGVKNNNNKLANNKKQQRSHATEAADFTSADIVSG